MKTKIQPIILCGGDGTRLWPLSRSTYPKQLLAPFGGLSLLQETAKRYFNDAYKEPIFICNEQYRFLVAEQLHELCLKNPTILLEPESRDTANAIAAALHYLNDADGLTLVAPSDHRIQNEESFHKYVTFAHDAMMQGYIVMLGIKPNSPATGYGYIKPANKLDLNLMHVEQFIEKPMKEAAESLITGGCVWNAGIFCFQNKTMQAHIKTLLPETDILTKESVEKAKKDLDFIRLDSESFANLTKKSIDYGVMEHIDQRAIIVCDDLGWSDVGDWNSVWNDSTKDENGNAINGDVVTHGVKNSYLRSDGLLISAIGVEDLIIVASSDAVLVANRHQSELVKEMAISLRRDKRSEVDCHKRVYRPWGFYQETDIGERFKVKRLMIKSGGKTSTQIHYHRSEHWVVVSGTASVTLGEQVQIVHENQAIYIPAGQLHAVENPGKIELHLIEVQSGSYLGEDDIVRIEDRYGRAPNVSG